MAKAPKPYSKKETAYQKALRSGSSRSAAAHRKGYVAYSSPEGLKRREQARKKSEKYQNSKWSTADNIASEFLIGLTSAREVKKVLRGNATKGDYARILGNIATYSVPYGKIAKGVNVAVGGKTLKNAISASKTKSIAKGSSKAATRAKAAGAGAGAAGKKVVRGVGKGTGFAGAAMSADALTQKGVNKILRNKKGK